MASSGDSGEGVNYPAANPNVIAVGGTSLSLDASGNYLQETAWSGSGGGESSYFPPPINQSQWAPNAGRRSIPDVAMVADPCDGVVIYHSDGLSLSQMIVGGTSVGAPIWSGLIADINSMRGTEPLSNFVSSNFSSLYVLETPGVAFKNFNPILAGCDNAPFQPVNCAHPGYNTVTGMGSPVVPTLAKSEQNDFIGLESFSGPATFTTNTSSQPICLSGSNCYVEVPIGEPLSVTAQPQNGYQIITAMSGCSNYDGASCSLIAADRQTVVAILGSNGAVSVSLSANTLVVNYGETVTLNWSAAGNAQSCTLSNLFPNQTAASPVALIGTASTPPLFQSTSFTLSCSGPWWQGFCPVGQFCLPAAGATETVNVQVLNPPPPGTETTLPRLDWFDSGYHYTAAVRSVDGKVYTNSQSQNLTNGLWTGWQKLPGQVYFTDQAGTLTLNSPNSPTLTYWVPSLHSYFSISGTCNSGACSWGNWSPAPNSVVAPPNTSTILPLSTWSQGGSTYTWESTP